MPTTTKLQFKICGRVLCAFWATRLLWFQLQSDRFVYFKKREKKLKPFVIFFSLHIHHINCFLYLFCFIFRFLHLKWKQEITKKIHNVRISTSTFNTEVITFWIVGFLSFRMFFQVVLFLYSQHAVQVEKMKNQRNRMWIARQREWNMPDVNTNTMDSMFIWIQCDIALYQYTNCQLIHKQFRMWLVTNSFFHCSICCLNESIQSAVPFCEWTNFSILHENRIKSVCHSWATIQMCRLIE